MIKRKMQNNQKKGGKRNLVKKATSGLLMTSLATGVVMNANVLEAHARPIFLSPEESTKARSENAERVILEGLHGYYTHDPSLEYGQYRRALEISVATEEGQKDAITTIAKLLNYHGSKTFSVSAVSTNEQERTVKVVIGFNPNTQEKDDKGYAKRLNYTEQYSETQMKELEKTYASTLERIGYNVTDHTKNDKTNKEIVDNVRFQRNYDNGRKQYEYDLLMGIMDKYIKENKDQAGQQFFIDVWEEGPIKDVCVRVWVSTVEKDAEKEVDSEQADLLEKIAILKKGYEERKAQEVVAPQPVVEKVEKETEVVEDVQADEPVVEESQEPSSVTVKTEEGEEVEVQADENGFIRTNGGTSIVVSVEGETEAEKAMYNYGETVNKEMVRLINEVRTQKGLPQLEWDDTAILYANERSLDMLKHKAMSLKDANGVSPVDHLRNAKPSLTKGYHAVGQCVRLEDPKTTARNLFDKFMVIDNIDEKLSDPSFTHIAVGVAFEGYDIFVTEMFTAY